MLYIFVTNKLNDNHSQWNMLGIETLNAYLFWIEQVVIQSWFFPYHSHVLVCIRVGITSSCTRLPPKKTIQIRTYPDEKCIRYWSRKDNSRKGKIFFQKKIIELLAIEISSYNKIRKGNSQYEQILHVKKYVNP